jgi:hypothetical protein
MGGALSGGRGGEGRGEDAGRGVGGGSEREGRARATRWVGRSAGESPAAPGRAARAQEGGPRARLPARHSARGGVALACKRAHRLGKVQVWSTPYRPFLTRVLEAPAQPPHKTRQQQKAAPRAGSAASQGARRGGRHGTHARGHVHAIAPPAARRPPRRRFPRLVGVVQEVLCDELHLLGPGGAPQQCLAVGADLVDDLADLGGLKGGSGFGGLKGRGGGRSKVRGLRPKRLGARTHTHTNKHTATHKQHGACVRKHTIKKTTHPNKTNPTWGSKPMSSMRSASSSTR